MELIKKEDRKTKIVDALHVYKVVGAKIENLGSYKKWKNISTGRISVTMTIYKIDLVNVALKTEGHWYIMEDTLGRLCFSSDKVTLNEIKNWLKEKGYKTEKDWFISEEGMSEEDYNEWVNA